MDKSNGAATTLVEESATTYDFFTAVLTQPLEDFEYTLMNVLPDLADKEIRVSVLNGPLTLVPKESAKLPLAFKIMRLPAQYADFEGVNSALMVGRFLILNRMVSL